MASNNQSNQENENFKLKVLETVIAESESAKNSLKELVQIRNNCREFQEKELSLRRKVAYSSIKNIIII